MTEFTSEEIKNRLSNIGAAIGNIALEYITKIEEENEQLVKYCKELEAGFLNYKKNYKTKRQKVFDLETRVRNFENENEQLKAKLNKLRGCYNCKHRDNFSEACALCDSYSSWELKE